MGLINQEDKTMTDRRYTITPKHTVYFCGELVGTNTTLDAALIMRDQHSRKRERELDAVFPVALTA